MSAKLYDSVALIAPVSEPYTRFSDHGAPWFIGRTLRRMLERAGLDKSEVDGLAIASFHLVPDSVVTMTDYLGISPRWIEQLPMGGASGVIALRRAARAVQCGDARIVACIGADSNRRGGFKELVANFSNFWTDAVHPYGASGPNGVFAMITRNYMNRFGATREDFGRLCIAQRYNAQAAPNALLKEPLSMHEYLAARVIADPLHLFDCVMPCAGGEGFLVVSADHARSLSLPFVSVLAAAERYNAYPADDIPERSGWDIYRDELYQTADLTPEGIDILQTYDDYPVISMMQMEDLGFCKKGEAPAFIRSTPLTFDGGGLPHNTSGGQLSAGQAGAAGGFLGIVEALHQLTDVKLPNRVPNARTALVSGYGMVNFDRCLCTGAAILASGDA